MSGRRLVILAEGTLDFHHGKTTTSLLRYIPEDVVAVIDSFHAGKTTGQVVGLAGDTPIVADVAATLSSHPSELVIGIAPSGGGLPAEWRPQILHAIEHGMDVSSGLHTMLADDPEFAAAAGLHGSTILDLRRPPPNLPVAGNQERRTGSQVVTFVGSDCAVGKMTAAWEVALEAKRRGLSSDFVATGQTGIMLRGSGIAVDRVIGDFMSGAVQKMVLEAAESADLVFVEGQGSLLHPAYSGVTLALLHGSAPDAMILVHPPEHLQIEGYPVPVPELSALVSVYETAAGWVKPARVVAIALTTRGMSDADTRRAMRLAREQTGVPVTDPVRYGAGPLLEAVLERSLTRS